MGFENRKEQVFDEKLTPIRTKEEPIVSLFTVQKHNAKRSGLHYDHRIVVGDRAISFVNKTGLPKKSNEKKLAIRTPDHKADYALWEGTIPSGYGAGEVKLVDKESAVIKIPSKDKIDLRIYKGPNKGNYVFKQTIDPSKWIIIRRKLMEDFFAKRMKFSGDFPEIIWTDPRYIAEEKKNGSMVWGLLTKKGISLVSRRKSVTGDLLHKEDFVPHLRDIPIPKELIGTKFAGELYHPMGFHFLSSMLNSIPDKTVEVQKRYGKIKLAPFELVEPANKKNLLPYSKRREILEDITKKLDSDFIKVPQSTNKNKKQFYKKIISQGGEGIVLKNIDEVYGKGTWFKSTPHPHFDAKIVDFQPGKGKFKNNAIGAIIVEGKDGQRFKIGTGLTESLRKDMYKNPKNYIGHLVKIKKNSVDAPVFSLEGFTTDKNTPDIIPAYKGDILKEKLLGSGVNAEDVSKVKYAILSSLGWRRKKASCPNDGTVFFNSFYNELRRKL